MKIALAVAALVLAATACGDANGIPARDLQGENAGPSRLEIEAFDFAFEIEAPIPAGEVETVLVNRGKQPHQALLYRLNDDVDFETFKKRVMEDDSALPELADGGTDGIHVAIGNDETRTARGDELVAGTYAAICWVQDQSMRSNKNHAELGMITRFEVE